VVDPNGGKGRGTGHWAGSLAGQGRGIEGGG
jgi:hypothetical protein